MEAGFSDGRNEAEETGVPGMGGVGSLMVTFLVGEPLVGESLEADNLQGEP